MKSIVSSVKLDLISVIICMCLIRTVLLNLYGNVTFNHMLDGFPLKQITGLSFAECWSNCEARASCKSINYKRQFHRCYLNMAMETGTIQLTQAVGFVYKAKDNQPNNDQICRNNACSEGEVCSLQNKCEIQECPALDTILQNIKVTGNTLSCGNKATVRCRDGFQTTTGSDAILAECLSNGTWTFNSTLNCTKGMKKCKDYYDNGDNATGIKTIFPNGKDPIDVLCVMDVDEGGWTVIQKRETDSDFYKSWQEYRDGFGDAINFWLGLENIHRLTSQRNYELRVDMRRASNVQAAAKYRTFSVGSEIALYKLSVGGYSYDPSYVDPGDSLAYYHNTMKFTTKARDNDGNANSNCAQKRSGGYWYNSCHKSHLNGLYGSSVYSDGINWYSWTGFYESLVYTRMMIRPK